MQEQKETSAKLTWQQLDYYAWKSANVVTVVGTTSLAISFLHNPLNEYMFAKLSNRPFSTTRIWLGLSAYLTATMGRTSYMTGAKAQYAQKQGMSAFEIAFYASVGDVVTSQASEVLSQIRKLPEEMLKSFNWKTKHNAYKLGVTTVGARFGFAYTNFLTLCMVEPIFVQRIRQYNVTHNKPNSSALEFLIAGLASGTLAAVLSFLFSFYRDFRLEKAIIVDGKLSVPSITDTCQQLHQYCRSAGVKKIVIDQVMPRIARTGSRFALFSGIGAFLGDEPLKNLYRENKSRLGFFHVNTPTVSLSTNTDEKQAPIQRITDFQVRG